MVINMALFMGKHPLTNDSEWIWSMKRKKDKVNRKYALVLVKLKASNGKSSKVNILISWWISFEQTYSQLVEVLYNW